MSVRQPNTSQAMAGLVPPDVAPKIKITTNLPNSGQFTFMCWAKYDPGAANYGDAYSDLIAITDLNDVIGMGIKNPNFGTNIGPTNFNMGDLNADVTDNFDIPFGEWHHYCMTVGDILGTGTRAFGYFDGRLRITGSLINPAVPVFIALINSRASDTDVGAVWNGCICAVKIWNGPALDPAEILREMYFYTPQRMNNLWAWTPMQTAAMRTFNFGGQASTDWTTQSNMFVDGDDPAGVVWDNPMKLRDLSQIANQGTWTPYTVGVTRRAPIQQRY